MARYMRDSAILAKIETTEGTDASPTGGSNAILVSDQSIDPLVANNVPRDLIRNYFGASEHLVGTAYLMVEFTVELQGSGTAATAPAWGALLRACGMAESGLVSYAAYAPDTPSAQKSVTIYYYDSGVVHKLLGAKGTITEGGMSVGGRPTLRFQFIGVDGGISAASVASTTLTGWKTPAVITTANSGDLTVGGTYSAGAVSGGTAYTSKGLTFAMGNEVQFTPLLGLEGVDITGREVTGSIELDLTAAQEVTFMGLVKANTLQSLSLVHGATTGYIVGVSFAAVQLLNPKKTEINGRRLCGYDFRSVPSAGNDDLIIWSK